MIDYDSPEQVALRKGQGDPIIMYLVVRESLGMSAGKLAAQAGHVVDMVFHQFLREAGFQGFQRIMGHESPEGPVAVNRYEPAEDPTTGELVYVPHTPETQAMLARHELYIQWRRTSFRKVTLGADEKEWAKVKASQELTYQVVRDAGLTEVEPGSETVMAVWPMHKSQAPKVLKRLQVLK